MLKNKKKKGMTLLETVISFAILAIVLTPMFSLISSGVQTNKLGEDTQKQLYILQKYSEEFKRKDIDANNLEQTFYRSEDNDIPKGDFVTVKIEPLSQYEFEDVKQNQTEDTENNSSDNNDNSYSDLNYNAKIIIEKNDNGNGVDVAHLYVQDKDGNRIEPIDEKNLEADSSYTLNINNGDDNGSRDLSIGLNKGNTNDSIGSWQIEDGVQDSNKSVLIQLDANEEQNENIALNVNCYNKAGNLLTIYVARAKDSTASGNYDIVNCSFNNEIGLVQVYSNIYHKTDTGTVYSDTRLYRGTISLFKEGQNPEHDKPIRQSIVYKTASQ